MNKNPNKKSVLQLHSRNKHHGRYDFQLLIQSSPELSSFVSLNKYENESIDFFNPEAVKALNRALLKTHYNIQHWDIPKGYLCPPIPGRADYIHHISDLLSGINNNTIPKGNKIHCLDIGSGANAIYPLIGSREYAWSFIGSDIDKNAIKNAAHIINSNDGLNDIQFRNQENPNFIFKGIIKENEYFDVTICNPPFHRSKEEAQAGSLRKLNNLKKKKVKNITLNFGGQSNELWCEGGEKTFIYNMINESREFSDSCLWFTTLVSKEAHLSYFHKQLKKVGIKDSTTIEMGTGNKISRILAWTFLGEKQRETWAELRW